MATGCYCLQEFLWRFDSATEKGSARGVRRGSQQWQRPLERVTLVDVSASLSKLGLRIALRKNIGSRKGRQLSYQTMRLRYVLRRLRRVRSDVLRRIATRSRMTKDMEEEVARAGPSNCAQPGPSDAAEEDLIPRRTHAFKLGHRTRNLMLNRPTHKLTLDLKKFSGKGKAKEVNIFAVVGDGDVDELPHVEPDGIPVSGAEVAVASNAAHQAGRRRICIISISAPNVNGERAPSSKLEEGEDAMDVNVKSESESDSGAYHSPQPVLDSESDENSNSASASHSNQTKPSSPAASQSHLPLRGRVDGYDGVLTLISIIEKSEVKTRIREEIQTVKAAAAERGDSISELSIANLDSMDCLLAALKTITPSSGVLLGKHGTIPFHWIFLRRRRREI
ncbi:hypothetical protein M422DRAFT_247313 [Sphaerobolus stellatus SS14]|nr:hypothetical protein M422DRAFT_247313 [Sphaerobolus stellatus SS14]